GSTLRMGVTYTFPDVNHNGISDLWEQQFFGIVNPGRTSTTDTDSDGVSDLHEFLSGTDPSNASSRLGLSTSKGNNSLTLQWPSVQNFAYQVQGTSDFAHWNPLTPWFIGNSLTNSFVLTQGIMGTNYVFRLEVRP
ncbi:MAG: hypothetical protein JWN25_3068, partial [Verrucomicrobiales bacterium]|nr:hypothetical protein [Verrucomicrobiales bacterium]